jgi:aminopeptidase
VSTNGYPIESLADLVVGSGANVQRGQIVEVSAGLGKEELTRAIAASAYKRGAKFVDVSYFDNHVKRARIAHADEDVLEFVPAWYGQRALQLGEERAAVISLSGPTDPHLFDDLDPARVGRDKFPAVKEYIQVINERTVNWSIAPCPTRGWAKLVHPELEPDDALAKLWSEVAHVCRLDTDDPGPAWRERGEALMGAAARMTDRGFDALHFEGPGTDLTVGLLPGHRWLGGGAQTVDGIRHLPNLPTEEVFTTPDPARTEGVVRATKPLYTQGRIVDGLAVRFEGGRAVQIDAETGAETLRTMTERDEDGARLGEVALVDRDGRIGSLDTVFFDTLLDENAASHIALGAGFDAAVDEAGRERINRSEIHVDFMIGAPDVDVTGITRDGDRVPVLRDATWQI